jgi:hypothetical protein
MANLSSLDFDETSGLIKIRVQRIIGLLRFTEPTLLVEAGNRFFFGVLDIEQFIQLRDFEDFHHVGGYLAKLQADFLSFALFIQHHQLGNHCRRHERYAAKVQQQFLVNCLWNDFLQLFSDLLNSLVIQNLAVGKTNNQNLAVLFRGDGWHQSMYSRWKKEKRIVSPPFVCPTD